MLSITLQIAMIIGFIALMVLIWQVSRRPRWRIRAVVYGWAAVFLYAFLWAGILPMSLRGVMDSHTIAETFPDGTIAMAALAGGWFWPLIVTLIGRRSGSEKL
jgi:NADH:ubiquinone oxidoreductase subunit 6 (subunit J)